MPAVEFKRLLKQRLEELRKAPNDENNTVQDDVCIEQRQSGMNNPYIDIVLEVHVEPEVERWCLMTHIPKLIACVSNIALEPVKKVTPEGPSQIFIKPYGPERPQSLSIEVITRFGAVSTALETVAKAAKIKRNFEELRLFDVKVEEPTKDFNFHNGGLRFSLVVPVGFQ